MDFDSERIAKLILTKDNTEKLQGTDFTEYLYKLGSYKLDHLKKEQIRLSEENKAVVEHTQDLAITNYKTFIQTSECSREIFKEFKDTEKQLDCLLEKLPTFNEKCLSFMKTSTEINTSRRLNSLTLKKNAQLLEILELPQLMDTCIRENKYEEALELAAHVQKMGSKHGNIPVINSITVAIEASWHTMLLKLLSQLSTDLQLPKCLQIVGYLRRMQAFTNSELKLKFLQSRDIWLNNILDNISCEDRQQHLLKTIELTRNNLFNIITQYKSIFSDEDSSTASKEHNSTDFNQIFYSWLHERIQIFVKTLEDDLSDGQISLEAVLGPCMYIGLSLSRVGADFRGLMGPIFIKVAQQNFTSTLNKLTQQFAYEMDNFTLMNKITSGLNRNKPTNEETENCSPPDALLDFYPLAVYCNGILTAFNELRLCSPIAIVGAVTEEIQKSLVKVCQIIYSFYRQEQQAFSSNERDIFIKLCSCFADSFIPYIQRCIHVIFPLNLLTSCLGINLHALQKEQISFLKNKEILEPIAHLLPERTHLGTQTAERKITETLVN